MSRDPIRIYYALVAHGEVLPPGVTEEQLDEYDNELLNVTFSRAFAEQKELSKGACLLIRVLPVGDKSAEVANVVKYHAVVYDVDDVTRYLTTKMLEDRLGRAAVEKLRDARDGRPS